MECSFCDSVFKSASGYRRHVERCRFKPKDDVRGVDCEDWNHSVPHETGDGSMMDDLPDIGSGDDWDEPKTSKGDVINDVVDSANVDEDYVNFFKYDLQKVPSSVKNEIVSKTLSFFDRNSGNEKVISGTFDAISSGKKRLQNEFSDLGLEIKEVTFFSTSNSNEKLYLLPIEKIFPFYLSLGRNRNFISKCSKLSLRIVEVDYRELSTSELIRTNEYYRRAVMDGENEVYPLLIYLDKVKVASKGRLFFDFQVGILPAKARQTLRHIVTFAGCSDPCVVRVGIDDIVDRVVSPIIDLMNQYPSKEVTVLGMTYRLNIFPLAFLGDNDESQNVSGCKKNFNNFPRRISRFCLCAKEDFYEYNCLCVPRTMDLMIEVGSQMELYPSLSTTLGILWGVHHIPRSIFKIPFIQYPSCFPPDIAHDILEGMAPREIDSNLLKLLRGGRIHFEEYSKLMMEVVKKFELYRFGKFKVKQKYLGYYGNKRNPSERCQYSAGVSLVLFQIFLFLVLKLNPNIDLTDEYIRRYMKHFDVFKAVFSRDHNENSIQKLDNDVKELLDLAKTSFRPFFKLHNYKIYPRFLRLYGNLVDIMLLIHEIKNKILKNLYMGGPNVVKSILLQSALQLKDSYDNPKSDIRFTMGVEVERDSVDDVISKKFSDEVFTEYNKIYLFELPIRKSVLLKVGEEVHVVEEIYKRGFVIENLDVFFVCSKVRLCEIDGIPYKEVKVVKGEKRIVLCGSIEKIMFQDELFFKGLRNVVILTFDKTSALFASDPEFGGW